MVKYLRFPHSDAVGFNVHGRNCQRLWGLLEAAGFKGPEDFNIVVIDEDECIYNITLRHRKIVDFYNRWIAEN